ncbi:MAG: prolipoprotein diacylglyceryl transferase [Balneolales bacterium]
MNSDYFFWQGDPILVDFGAIPLPFPLNLFGLILGVIAFFGLSYYLSAQEETKSKKKRQAANETSELSGWQLTGLFVGCMVIAQLVFLVFPSPVISQIGPIVLRWYGILFASAFLLAYFLARLVFRQSGKPVIMVESLLTYMLVATIVGARLGHVIFYDIEYYAMNPDQILAVWRGGLASHGAAIAILIGIWLFVKKHHGITFLWLTDRAALTAILGGAFVRIGNFFNSEIYGIPTEVPWAVIFAQIDMQPRHPSMLYEALLCVFVFVVLWKVYKSYQHQPPEGFLTGIFFIILFMGRFLIEYTKVEQAEFATDWFIGMGQLLSIPFVIVGIWLLTRVDWKQARVKQAEDPDGKFK